MFEGTIITNPLITKRYDKVFISNLYLGYLYFI
jgi:hypothetical protein